MLNCFVWNFFKSLTNSNLPGASGLDPRPLPPLPAWPAAWSPPPAPAAPPSARPSRSPSSRRTRSRRCRSNGSFTGGWKLFQNFGVADPWHLVWIRISGSMPVTNRSGCGSGSCFFRHWPSRCKKKFFWFFSLLFQGTLTSFFKGKKSKQKEVTRQ